MAGYKHKKSLGQHFLTNQGIIDRIARRVVAEAQFWNNDHVVEFGPGDGALTRSLLKQNLTVFAIELDADCILSLKSSFASEIAKGKLILHHTDATSVNISILSEFVKKSPAVVCGNLPYNVGVAIFMRCLEDFGEAHSFCFMLQREVVARIISEGLDADFGPLAVKSGLSTELIEKFWVKPGSFNPPPKVESGVFCLRLKPVESGMWDPKSNSDIDRGFSEFLRKLFQHRRKMLRGLLALGDDPRGSKRPQELSPEELWKLYCEQRETHRE